MNKRINKGTFWIVSILIALITYMAIFGVSIGSFNIPSASDMRFGIDIRGGVEATYFPKDYKGVPSATELDSAKLIMEERCDAQNILDREITVNRENGSILVRFPWKSDETEFNPEKAIAELGETALLTFRDQQGNILLEGKNVKNAMAQYDQQTGQQVVALEFDNEGAKLFEQATKKLIGSSMAIYMDDMMISNPRVEEKIAGGQAVITGMANAEEAGELASKINSGSLPFSLESKNYNAISPIMGTGALDVMVYAGIIAFIIICLFMIIKYRLPGVVAVFALMLQVTCQLLALSVPQFTLTLPGIAAVILSIGMGVDANIITAERIREEIADGKSVRAAIDSGFHKAFSSVFDGNITVIIVAIILMIFGSGTMLSFGYSLLTGVILNFLCGVLTSKLMMQSLSNYEKLRKPKFFGNGKKNEKVLRFYQNRIKCYLVSLAIFLVGIVCIFTNGIDFDIQFKGGAIINYTYTQEIDTNEAMSVVEETLGRQCDIQTKSDLTSDSTKLVLNRENKLLYGNKMPIEEIVNKSISQSFTRSLNTNICTLLSIVVVYIFAYVQDIQSIKSFALPMIFAIISGCYSTICIAGPIWVSWQKHKEKKAKGKVVSES